MLDAQLLHNSYTHVFLVGVFLAGSLLMGLVLSAAYNYDTPAEASQYTHTLEAGS